MQTCFVPTSRKTPGYELRLSCGSKTTCRYVCLSGATASVEATHSMVLHRSWLPCYELRVLPEHERSATPLQAYEVLEIFLELLTVRLQMIEKSVDIPNDMFECLASLVYAASRVQVSPPNTCHMDEIGHVKLLIGWQNCPHFVFKR